MLPPQYNSFLLLHTHPRKTTAKPRILWYS